MPCSDASQAQTPPFSQVTSQLATVRQQLAEVSSCLERKVEWKELQETERRFAAAESDKESLLAMGTDTADRLQILEARLAHMQPVRQDRLCASPSEHARAC
jgi:septal ring factor EnvC (AmiA/AmiB activator)